MTERSLVVAFLNGLLALVAPRLTSADLAQRRRRKAMERRCIRCGIWWEDPEWPCCTDCQRALRELDRAKYQQMYARYRDGVAQRLLEEVFGS